MIPLVFAELSLVVVLCVIFLIVWLNRTLGGSAQDPQRKRIVRNVLAVLLFWLAFTGALAEIGFLSAWSARPPRFPIVPVVGLVAIVWVNRARFFGLLINATPRYLPVAFQSFRIGVELAFWGLFAAGGAPVQVTFEGRNFDVLVGLTAPFVAFAIAKLALRPGWVIAWNVAGILILSNTIATTLTSLPGPLHRNWPGVPFTAFGSWPFVWIPAFLAPLAICVHIFSIRQNVRAMAHPNAIDVSVGQ